MQIPLSVRLSGGEADAHRMPAYDGFQALSGLSLATTMVAHYASTGKLRRKGQFEARSSLQLVEMRPGSLVFAMMLEMTAQSPQAQAVIGTLTVAALYDVLKHAFLKTVGITTSPETKQLKKLIETDGGGVEALSAAIEPSLQRAHTIIGVGADKMDVSGRDAPVAAFNSATKAYINTEIEDEEIYEKFLSVASFNANSGHGRVFDYELGRTVAAYIPEQLQAQLKKVFGWGLSQYSSGTAKFISVKFKRILAIDGRPKKYIILDARIPED